MSNLLFKATKDGTYTFTTAGFTAMVIVMLAVLLLGVFVFGRKKGRSNAKQIAFSAMAIALAMVTSLIKIFEMPMGGSVTLLSMLFIVMVGYWYGLGNGLMAAIAYGILQMVIDPYIISFPQMMVDYVFAFGALGLAGVFHNKKNGLIKGYIIGVIGRYFFATLSGVIFFGMYAPKSFPNPLVYSLAYNGSYLGVEAVITIAILLLPPVRSAVLNVKNIAVGQE